MVVTKQNGKLSEITSSFRFIFDHNPSYSGDYLCLVRHDDDLHLDNVYCDVEPDDILWWTSSWD